jgi:hypothetical protein
VPGSCGEGRIPAPGHRGSRQPNARARTAEQPNRPRRSRRSSRPRLALTVAAASVGTSWPGSAIAPPLRSTRLRSRGPGRTCRPGRYSAGCNQVESWGSRRRCSHHPCGKSFNDHRQPLHYARGRRWSTAWSVDAGERQCWATIRSGLGAGLQEPIELDAGPG